MSYRYNADDVRIRLKHFQGPPGDATAANEAAARADNAAAAAENAAAAANNAATKAGNAAQEIVSAADTAQAAAKTANTAAEAANRAASSANSATLNVNAAASGAETAAAQARSATESAITATNNANSAATAAVQATNGAQSAAQNAKDAANLTVQATGAAEEATQDALAAAGAANNAANRANTQADAAAANTQALKDVHPQAVAATEAANTAAANTAAANAQAATDDSKARTDEAVANAQAATQEAQTAADDATAAAETARSTIYTRAVAIPDTSALAASHELYAQKDHPLNVRVHSHTYQEGEGDPSPENARLIHGLDAAHMRAGGKNLFDLATWMSMTSTLKGVFYVSDAPVLAAGEYIWICTEYSQVDDLQYTLALVNESGGAFNLIRDGSVKEQTLIKSDTPLCWRLNWNPNTFPNKVAAITAQLESGSVGTPYEPYIANTADLPLLPDGAPLMEGDTVENWGKSGCDARKVISSADDLTLENFDASVNVVYSDTAASIAVTDGVITSALTYPTTVYYRSTDYTPDKDLRVCRVTRKMYTMTLDGSENWGTDQAYLVTNITKAAANRYAGAKQYANMYRADSGIAQEGGIAVSDKVYVKDSNFTTGTEFKNALVERAAAGNPLVVSYELATPEVYMTDPLPLLPPAALESDTVTVTGSGKTEVEYAHETKHFIIDFVTKALASQS